MNDYLAELNCEHEGEWIHAEPENNVVEDMICVHWGIQLPLPQEDDDW